jgi:hypothetical protein
MVQKGSVIRDSQARRTLDDGIAVNSILSGWRSGARSPSRLVVQRYFRHSHVASGFLPDQPNPEPRTANREPRTQNRT